MKIFSVRDVKGGYYLPPNSQRTIADALRSWESVANEHGNAISQFPHDFRLIHLADFDSDTGTIRVLEHSVDLGSAAEFKNRPQAQQASLFNADRQETTQKSNAN